MLVYATVDRIEEQWAVCEVELVDTQKSRELGFFNVETQWCDISLESTESVGLVGEGDVLIVELKDEEVIEIYQKDDEEKQYRKELLNAM